MKRTSLLLTLAILSGLTARNSGNIPSSANGNPNSGQPPATASIFGR